MFLERKMAIVYISRWIQRNCIMSIKWTQNLKEWDTRQQWKQEKEQLQY